MPQPGYTKPNLGNRRRPLAFNGGLFGRTGNPKPSKLNLLRLILAIKTNQNMNSQITAIVGTFVRHGLTLVAGKLLTGDQVEIVAGAVTAVVVVAWSVWQKRKAKA